MFFNQINQCSIRDAFTKHFYLQFMGSNMYALVRSISAACIAGIERVGGLGEGKLWMGGGGK